MWVAGHDGSMQIFHSIALRNSVFLSVGAAICGQLVYRQLTDFPGASSGYYVMHGALICFALVGISAFLFRLDYSRPLVFGGFIGALAFCFFYYSSVLKNNTLNVLLVSGGNLRDVNLHSFTRDAILTEPLPRPGAVDAVLADLHHDHSNESGHYITRCVLAGVPVYDVKDFKERLIGRVEIEHLSESGFGGLLPSNLFLKTKRLIDLFLAVVLFPFVLVIVLVTSLMIRIESPGAALFKQERIGFQGRIFTIYKLRSMRSDSNEGKPFTESADPRITRVGSFIRKYRIDELPQIINIFKGDMSWIGPRPETSSLAKWYANDIPFYEYRYAVRPGITGWAQVNQGNVAELEAATVKLQYDFFYIKYFSPWLDALIIMRTLKTILVGFEVR